MLSRHMIHFVGQEVKQEIKLYSWRMNKYILYLVFESFSLMYRFILYNHVQMCFLSNISSMFIIPVLEVFVLRVFENLVSCEKCVWPRNTLNIIIISQGKWNIVFKKINSIASNKHLICSYICRHNIVTITIRENK